MTRASRLSPRVAVAQLTLQLRRTLHDAAAAEAAADQLDPAAAVAQLRAKLEPRVAERRQALDDELRRTEYEARAAVAEARAEADRIVAAAEERVAEARAAEANRAAAARAELAALAAAAAAAEPAVDLTVASPYEGLDDLDDPAIVPEGDPVPELDEAEVVDVTALPDGDADDEQEEPADASGTITLPATIGDSPWADGGRAVHVVIDADAFAKAFAAALGPVLDALHQSNNTAIVPQTYVPQPYIPAGYVPVAQAPERKQSFWAHAWHPDVLLSGLAMVIVVIVLIAWTG